MPAPLQHAARLPAKHGCVNTASNGLVNDYTHEGPFHVWEGCGVHLLHFNSVSAVSTCWKAAVAASHERHRVADDVNSKNISVCVCVCVNACMLRWGINVCMQRSVCRYVCIHTCMHVCMYVHTYNFVHVSMDSCMCNFAGADSTK